MDVTDKDMEAKAGMDYKRFVKPKADRLKQESITACLDSPCQPLSSLTLQICAM